MAPLCEAPGPLPFMLSFSQHVRGFLSVITVVFV
jgi:hypothetical protein